LVFSFNKVVSVIVFGITVGIIHWTLAHFKLKPPKDFFCNNDMFKCYFNLISVDSQNYKKYRLYDFWNIINMFGSVFVLFHSEREIKSRKNIEYPSYSARNKKKYYIWNIFEYSFRSRIFLKFEKSILSAIMHGSSPQHIFQRSTQRITGTLIGVFFLL